MKCLVAHRLMSSYLDGAVTRSEFSQVDEHLQGLPGVRRALRLLAEDTADWWARWDASLLLLIWRCDCA